MLVYLDKQEDGGTAIYDGEWITNDENMALLYPVEERFNLRQVIPAKFNRCVVFPGNCMHGAYINDYHRYLENWRFTQVTFYHPQGDTMPIKVGGFAQSKMDGAEEIMEEVLSNDSINGTDQSEVVVDKYSGEEFEIERNSDFITILHT